MLSLAVLMGLVSVTLAVGVVTKTVAGIVTVRYVDEVVVSPVLVIGPESVEVRLSPNTSARPDTPYMVVLYLEGREAAIDGAQWTSAEIPGTETVILFEGLPLSGVTRLTVEVTRPSG